jgi:hypothetical protein
MAKKVPPNALYYGDNLDILRERIAAELPWQGMARR